MLLRPPAHVLPILAACLIAFALPSAATENTPVRVTPLESAPVLPVGAALCPGAEAGSLYQYGGEGSPRLWARAAGPAAGWSSPVSTPFARTNSLLFWQAAESRLVMYGGLDPYGQPSFEMYAYWPDDDLLVPFDYSRNRPSLAAATSAIDGATGRPFVLSGLRSTDLTSGPVAWTFGLVDASTWSVVATTAMPPYRVGTRLAHDAVGGRFLAYGETFEGDDRRRVWALDTATLHWTVVAAEGQSPVRATSMAIFHDALANALIVLSVDPQSFVVAGARLDLAGTPRWSSQPVELPAGLDGATLLPGLAGATYDARTNELSVPSDLGVIAFTSGATLRGRFTVMDQPGPRRFGAYHEYGHAWWWHDGDASRVHRTSSEPPYEDRVWTVPAPGGRRLNALAGYNVNRGRIFFYGGTVDGAPTNDLLELDPGDPPVWILNAPAGGQAPPPREVPSAIVARYNPTLIILETVDHSGRPGLPMRSTWADGGNWYTRELTAPLPFWPRWDAVEDRDGSTYYLVGRFDPAQPTSLRPVFKLRTDLEPMELTPLPAAPARAGAALEFVESRRWILLAGGVLEGETTSETWALPAYDPQSWLRLDQANPRSRGQTVTGGLGGYDGYEDRVVVLGGTTCLPGAMECLGSPGVEYRFTEPAGFLLALVGATVEPDRTVLVRLGANLGLIVTVSRSEDDGTTWSALGSARQTGFGDYEFVDASAVPGRPYRYRGSVDYGFPPVQTDPSATVIVPIVRYPVELRASSGSIVSAWPVSFVAQIIGGPAAVVELVDVRGRVLASESLPASSEEVRTTQVRLDPGLHAGPGLYFARLRQGGNSSVVKVVRL